MDKEDGRKLSVDALSERRKTIIRMKENGYGPMEIVQATGCSRQVIYPLWNRWKSGKGKAKEEVFCVRKRGTALGQYRTLTPRQEKETREKIKGRYPEQLKLDFALWTREAVKLLITDAYGIAMPIRTVGEYLRRWNYTPQKPVRYAYERDPAKVREWLENTYPRIKRRAKEEKGDIHWGGRDYGKSRRCTGAGLCAEREDPGSQPYREKRRGEYGIGNNQ